MTEKITKEEKIVNQQITIKKWNVIDNLTFLILFTPILLVECVLVYAPNGYLGWKDLENFNLFCVFISYFISIIFMKDNVRKKIKEFFL